jgi:hypothetical protein
MQSLREAIDSLASPSRHEGALVIVAARRSSDVDIAVRMLRAATSEEARKPSRAVSPLDVETWAKRHPGGIVIVDSLDAVDDALRDTDATDNVDSFEACGEYDDDASSTLVRRLRAIARESRCTVVVPWSVQQPRLADLAETVVEDADVVLLVHDGVAQIEIAKNRHGATGCLVRRERSCKAPRVRAPVGVTPPSVRSHPHPPRSSPRFRHL